MADILRVTSRRDGFRRAGLSHPASPVDHPADSLTGAQIDALLAEPMLVVEVVGVDDAPVARAAKGKGGAAS